MYGWPRREGERASERGRGTMRERARVRNGEGRDRHIPRVGARVMSGKRVRAKGGVHGVSDTPGAGQGTGISDTPGTG